MTVKVELKQDENPDIFSIAIEASSQKAEDLEIVDRIREAILNPDLKVEHGYVNSQRWVARITRRQTSVPISPV
jgi:hypothetical protein